MLIRLDPRSSEPIYLQIANEVAGQVESGALSAGDRLPAARSLGQTLQVNMHTVLKAYSALETRGLVEMRRGRGGVVVAKTADARAAAMQLVSAARRTGMDRSEVSRLVDEVW